MMRYCTSHESISSFGLSKAAFMRKKIETSCITFKHCFWITTVKRTQIMTSYPSRYDRKRRRPKMDDVGKSLNDTPAYSFRPLWPSAQRVSADPFRGGTHQRPREALVRNFERRRTKLLVNGRISKFNRNTAFIEIILVRNSWEC